MNNPIIEFHNVTKSFHSPLAWRKIITLQFKREKPVLALDNLSFSIASGTIVGILGANGAGKTTLLKIISTLILPDNGQITVCGNTPESNDQKIKSRIGLAVSEERSFYWRLTGMQNLKFFASMYGLNQKQASLRIKKLFRIFEVDYQDKRFDGYSTGMKRKFALIRALIHEPEILLLDEPTKSLDFGTSTHLRKMIRQLSNEGKTILFATHDMNEAQTLCDSFLILHKGKMLAAGNQNDLRDKIQNKASTLSEIYLKLTEYKNND